MAVSTTLTFEAGLEAFHQARYPEAISLLETFCQSWTPEQESREHWRAQMYLIETYQRVGQLEQAETLCQQLTQCSNAQVQIWAQQKIQRLAHAAEVPPDVSSTAEKRIECRSLTQRAKQLLSMLVGTHR